MTALHIYTAGKQPATAYCVDRNYWIYNPPQRTFRCHTCRRLRWAANLTVQVYYDYTRFACVDKARCKAGRRGKRRVRP